MGAPTWGMVSGELFLLTYGALVAQILKDYELDIEKVNQELDKIGHNIGVRLVEDYLRITKRRSKCRNFWNLCDELQEGFKLFLNVKPKMWKSANSYEFSLVFDTNPLGEFVELPDQCSELVYANLLGGAVRGALEMVAYEVKTSFVKDTLKGSDVTELRVTLVRHMEENVPPGDNID